MLHAVELSRSKDDIMYVSHGLITVSMSHVAATIYKNVGGGAPSSDSRWLRRRRTGLFAYHTSPT